MSEKSVPALKAALRERDDRIRLLEEELEAIRAGRDFVVQINADLIEELNQIRDLPARKTGRVKFFLPEGWGFIIPDDGSEDLFVHYRYIRGRKDQHKSLPDGARVTYETATGDRGAYANDVVVVQDGGDHVG